MLKEVIGDLEQAIEKAQASLKRDLSKLRTGRAHAGMLDSVRVDYYGQLTPLPQMATVAVPEPRMLTVKPWEKDQIKHVERAVTGADGIEGVVLRYGGFYGPGTSLARGGEQFEAIRERKIPVVGDGGGIWSFIEIGDAADATVAAIERGSPGIFNVVDDDPAPVSAWVPVAAEVLGAKPPRWFPRWLARVLAGEVMTGMMTEMRGASNEKAKRELGWRPAHPSWRQGFVEVAGAS